MPIVDVMFATQYSWSRKDRGRFRARESRMEVVVVSEVERELRSSKAQSFTFLALAQCQASGLLPLAFTCVFAAIF